MDKLEETVYTWEQCTCALIMRSLETNSETNVHLHHEAILCAAVNFTKPNISIAEIITASQSSLTVYAIEQCQMLVINQVVIKQGAYLHTVTPFTMLDLGFFVHRTDTEIVTNLAHIVSYTAMYCSWPPSINSSF